MRRSPERDRVLASVLFTDIVGSTELAARLGDRRWEELRRRHHAVVRSGLKRHGGREIDTAGDGFFAVFERPAQAIRCAAAIVEALRPLGIEIRAGIHAGEVELGREKVGGIAVHTGARVLAAAQPGEILVTGTVRDLVAGSELAFEERGVVALKGIPGEWRLYAVAAPAPAEGAVHGVPAEHERLEGERRARQLPWAVIGGVGVIVLGGVAATTLLLPSLLAGPLVPGGDTVARIPPGGDRFDGVVEVGSRPTAIAAGEGAIWVLNFGDQTLSRIEPETGRVDSPAVGGAPTGLAVGGGAVWVTTGFGTATGEGAVIRFNAASGQREGAITIGTGAAGIGFGEGYLWVADRVGDQLVRVDPRTEEREEIDVGRGPAAVAVGHGSVWVTSTLDGELSRVDPRSLDVSEVALGASQTGIAIGDDEIWVTSQTADSVMRVDPSGPALLSTFTAGNGPAGIAASGSDAWVSLALARQVVKIASDEAVVTLPVEGVPNGVAVDADGAAWVSISGE
jgi:class 3 adenylate cyclase/DNA-binding beta-propeller fold protein YncE